MDLPFLPGGPLVLDPALRIGLAILVATVLGEVAQKWLRLPRVLAYVLTGVGCGPHGLVLIEATVLADYRIVFELAIGMVLFEMGRRVDLSWLKRNPWLLATSLLEAGLAFSLVFTILWMLDYPPLLSALAAAICMATSPAVVLAITRDLRSQGQVTERSTLFSALDTTYAVLLVSLLFVLLHRENQGDWRMVVLHPLYLIFASSALGVAASGLTLLLVRYLGRRDDAQYAFLVIMVAIAVALGGAMKLSVVLAMLAYGISLRAFDRQRRFIALDFGRIELLLIIVLFVFVGASLQFGVTPGSAIAIVAVIAARFLGKTVAIWLLAIPSGLPIRKASLTSMALFPMAGLAVLLVQDTSQIYPAFGEELAAIVLGTVAALEIIGPIAVHFAVTHAGEGTGNAMRSDR